MICIYYIYEVDCSINFHVYAGPMRTLYIKIQRANKDKIKRKMKELNRNKPFASTTLWSPIFVASTSDDKVKGKFQ